VTNAIYLTRLGFYDGTKLHRVIKGFMAQGGCPLGNGRGDPGYRLNLELSPKVKHDKRGVLSTANSGPNTDGSQFFIMFKTNAGLDGGYSIYGQIDSGLNTLDKLEAVGANGEGPPTEPLTVVTATISVE
jgi:cyclophilin family peptidyl-prolyl cis-trans isomerase